MPMRRVTLVRAHVFGFILHSPVKHGLCQRYDLGIEAELLNLTTEWQ